MIEGAYSFLPECITAVEMETMDAVIRIETGADSLGRVFIEHKESGNVCEFSPLFCCDQFELIAQHMAHWREKAETEEQERQEQAPEESVDDPAIFGTEQERKQIQSTHGAMFKQPVSTSLDEWALK